MPLEIITVPCLEDNYAYLLHNPETDETALVDAPDPGPILQALKSRGWTLNHVLLTHHHWDHVDGLPGILAAHPAQVTGAAADANRLPPLDHAVREGDTLTVCGARTEILDVSGHTLGHIAFHLPDQKALFSADSLMALGCGRLFEGTPAQMWDSLCKMKDLPGDTTLYSGHEYTQSNARFALTIEPDNQALIARAKAIDAARAKGLPTVPSQMAEEQATNPFIRAHLSEVKHAIGMSDATDAAVFTEIRRRKDHF